MSHPVALAIGQIEEMLGFINGKHGRRPDDARNAYNAGVMAIDLLRTHLAAIQMYEPIRQEEIRP